LAIQPVDHFPALDPALLIHFWSQAMAIGLPESRTIRHVETTECVPRNSTFWSAWPTKAAPSVSASFEAMIFEHVLNRLK